jgi:cation transporter-like permease
MVVKWGVITLYALALLVAQFAIGLLEGLFAPTQGGNLILWLGSATASFLVCGGIFAHLAARQPRNPFAYAWAALALQVAMALALGFILAPKLDSTPLLLVILGFLLLVVALLVGTSLGSTRRRSVKRAEA